MKGPLESISNGNDIKILSQQLENERRGFRESLAEIEDSAQKHLREIERLRGLLYGAGVGPHLYRAWQVLIGNPHYRRRPVVPKIDPRHISGYHELVIEGLRVKFHKSALADNRGTGRVARELFRQFEFLAQASVHMKAADAPPVHFFAAPHWGPAFLPPRSCVVIHDAIPLVTPDYPKEQQAVFELRCREVIKQATQLITISQTSADIIARMFDVPRGDFLVIPNGINRLPVAVISPSGLPASDYLVYVGGGDSHKNLPVVFEALNLPEASGVHLVMIGENESLRPVADTFRISDRIHFLGRLEDAKIGNAVRRSLAMVFPSLHEGFGLPPLEAALLGVPSICSRRPAMTEFLDHSALFAEPDSPAEWAQHIHALSTDPALRKAVTKRARAAAENLQWSRTARAYVDAFKSMPSP